MVGIVIVTHGNLARELMNVAEHVVGKQERMIPICIAPDDDMEKCRQSILDAARKVDRGRGTVIMTDMFGGTPSNLAISIMEHGDYEVIAGVNLPALIKLVTIRYDVPMYEAALQAQESGRKYINVASNLLKSKAS